MGIIFSSIKHLLNHLEVILCFKSANISDARLLWFWLNAIVRKLPAKHQADIQLLNISPPPPPQMPNLVRDQMLMHRMKRSSAFTAGRLRRSRASHRTCTRKPKLPSARVCGGGTAKRVNSDIISSSSLTEALISFDTARNHLVPNACRHDSLRLRCKLFAGVPAPVFL